MCMEVYTDPVMINGCLHIYCGECIKSWTKKSNECPKCKETINGYSKQTDVEALLEFYQQKCKEEKAKLLKIKQLLAEREEIQSKINSMLDNQSSKPQRPSTAAPKRSEKMAETVKKHGDDFVIHQINEIKKKEKEFDENDFMCKICRRHPLSKPLQEYNNICISPISLNGNPVQQELLQNFMNTYSMTLDQIYNYVLKQLPTIDMKKLYPDCQYQSLKATDSACEECLYEFSESCIYYYCINNKHLIQAGALPNCVIGAYCPQQSDEAHSKAYNHFIYKGGD